MRLWTVGWFSVGCALRKHRHLRWANWLRIDCTLYPRATLAIGYLHSQEFVPIPLSWVALVLL